MTRIRISAVILLLVIVGCIGALLHVRHTCQSLLTLTEEIRICADRKDSEATEAAIHTLTTQWEEEKSMLNLLVQSDALLSVERILARFLPLLEQDSDELTAELDALETELRWMYESETPVWYRLF